MADRDAAAVPGFQTHVCLVSAQATPSLAPALDARFRPDEVLMVVTDDMRQRADWLEEVLKPRGVRVSRLAVGDPWDMGAMSEKIVTELTRAGRDPARIAFNLTGGTKTMAIAAQAAAAAARCPVFYVRHDTGDVLWLQPDFHPINLEGRLTLREFLLAHGYEVVSGQRISAQNGRHAELTRDLVQNVGSLARGLGTLNYLAGQANATTGLEQALDSRQQGNKSLGALLQKFEHAGLVIVRGDSIRFADEDARAYCNGGWLEEHVAAEVLAQKVALGVADAYVNLKVRSRDNTLRSDAGTNEIDVAFLAGNRLHLVECKAKRFEEEGSAAEPLYKLDSLHRLGGLNTRAMLVSYRELRDGDRQRARDLEVECVIGHAIRDLRSRLMRWMRG